eukprot:scaffold15603_cov19-Prasinocladus_malaysianus.AAC.1
MLPVRVATSDDNNSSSIVLIDTSTTRSFALSKHTEAYYAQLRSPSLLCDSITTNQKDWKGGTNETTTISDFLQLLTTGAVDNSVAYSSASIHPYPRFARPH